MKMQLNYCASQQICDGCGKIKTVVELYRPAKRTERENFYMLLCENCTKKILAEFSCPIPEHPKAYAQ